MNLRNERQGNALFSRCSRSTHLSAQVSPPHCCQNSWSTLITCLMSTLRCSFMHISLTAKRQSRGAVCCRATSHVLTLLLWKNALERTVQPAHAAGLPGACWYPHDSITMAEGATAVQDEAECMASPGVATSLSSTSLTCCSFTAHQVQLLHRS